VIRKQHGAFTPERRMKNAAKPLSANYLSQEVYKKLPMGSFLVMCYYREKFCLL
jgi:hypothetical protein